MDNHAYYTLGPDGAIQNWLVRDMALKPVKNLQDVVPATGDPLVLEGRWAMNYWAWHPDVQALKQRIYARSEHTGPQDDMPPVVGDVWRYMTTSEDHTLDFSRFNFEPTHSSAVGVTQLQSPVQQQVTATLLTIGPATVWVNGVEVCHYTGPFSYVHPHRVSFDLPLQAGCNIIRVQADMIAMREARLCIGLLVVADNVQVAVPIGDIDPDVWQQTETALSSVHLHQHVFTGLPVTAHYAEDAMQSLDCEVEVLLHLPDRAIIANPDVDKLLNQIHRSTANPGDTIEIPVSTAIMEQISHLPEESMIKLVFRPANGMPLSLEHHIAIPTGDFRLEPYGDYDTRRREALEQLAQIQFDTMAGVAAAEIGIADTIDSGAIAVALHFMNNRYDCADFYALALLVLVYGYADKLRPDDRAKIEQAFLQFKYWLDEPGLDAMCYFTENHQILFRVTEYLAGQWWRDAIFENADVTGEQHMAKAAEHIEDWILRRLRGGFSEWDSNTYMTVDVFAMLALVEYSQDERITEMATTLLHKIFFMLASQSFRGIHGCSHGRCYIVGLKSARVELSSGLQRIAWGLGSFSGETRATGMLALSKKYRVPDVIQRIGAEMPDVMLTRARSTEAFQLQYDMRNDAWDVSTYTYRTPDVMLAAAVEHRPGESGIQEHLWQATLSPEAVVFTNAPGNVQEHGHARPNFWAGSVTLPYVVMHERTVICMYQFNDIGMGFSHAYFPTGYFDEWHIEGDWAFARKGDGYVALWSDGELSLTQRGRHAMQELRSANGGNVWVCHIGRSAIDVDFSAFCDAVLADTPEFADKHLAWQTPPGDVLRVGWNTGLTVNGEIQPRAQDYPLYDNPYTQTAIGDERMTISHGGESVTLDLQNGRVL
ncbi:MAG: hypothetical protein AAF787_17030 [Chloroflexota bacterium]